MPSRDIEVKLSPPDAGLAPGQTLFRREGEYWTIADTEEGHSIGVAADQSGAFVVAWNSCDGQDGNFCGVFGQRFDSLAAPVGGEFQVNSYTNSDQGGYSDVNHGVAVASEPGGGFMVAWDSYNQDGYDWGVFGQRYDSAGSPSGDEFQINRYTDSRQDHPRVAADGSGGFVVAWQSGYQDDSDFGVFIDGPEVSPASTSTPTSTPSSTSTPTLTPTPTPPVGCASTPVGGCLDPGKGKLLIKDKAPAGASVKDKIIYKWLKGPMVDRADFGNPVSAGTDIFVCIYDNTGLVADLEAPGGSLWKALGTKGYSYKDTSKANDGLQKVLLKGGGAGKSKIIVKAKDGAIDMPGLALDDSSSVTVQVRRSDGADCWETVLPGPGDTNDSDTFKDQIP